VDGTGFVGGTLPGDTVSFVGGQTTETVQIEVSGDLSFESDEVFEVTISDATGHTG